MIKMMKTFRKFTHFAATNLNKINLFFNLSVKNFENNFIIFQCIFIIYSCILHKKIYHQIIFLIHISHMSLKLLSIKNFKSTNMPKKSFNNAKKILQGIYELGMGLTFSVTRSSIKKNHK